MRRVFRLVLAVAPLAMTPALVHLIATGALDFGGGEIDLVLVLPWALWSVLFAVSSLVLWRRGWPVLRSTVRSAIVGVAGLLLAAVVLALVGQLGVAGRF